MYKDLREFTTTTDDFKYIRRTVDAITEAKPVEVGSRAASMVSSGVPDGGNKMTPDSSKTSKTAIRSCVPFIGMCHSVFRGDHQLYILSISI